MTVAVVLAIWFVPPSVPTLLCMVLLPFVYYWVMRPEVTAMPDAPAAAKRALAALVSQTAHLLALFAVFVGGGVKLGVSAPLLGPPWLLLMAR